MAIEYVAPPNTMPPAGAYSYAVKANGFVFVSGLLPVMPDGRKLADAPFAEQARQILANLGNVLRASGTEPAHLVQVRVYLTDIENWAAFNTLYAEWVGTARPARCVVPVPVLHYGFAIEIEAVAVQAGLEKS